MKLIDPKEFIRLVFRFVAEAAPPVSQIHQRRVMVGWNPWLAGFEFLQFGLRPECVELSGVAVHHYLAGDC